MSKLLSLLLTRPSRPLPAPPPEHLADEAAAPPLGGWHQSSLELRAGLTVEEDFGAETRPISYQAGPACAA